MKEWAWVLRACGKSKIKFVLYFVFLFFGNSHGNHTNRHCKSQTDCLLTEYCDLQYSGTCQCRDGYVSGKEGSPCVKGRHAGETCLLDAQCALLNPSLVCFEGRCNCPRGQCFLNSVNPKSHQASLSTSPAGRTPPTMPPHLQSIWENLGKSKSTISPIEDRPEHGRHEYGGPIAICVLIFLCFTALVITTAYNFRTRTRRLEEVRSIVARAAENAAAHRRRASTGSIRDGPPSYNSLSPPSYEQATRQARAVSSNGPSFVSSPSSDENTASRSSYCPSTETTAYTVSSPDDSVASVASVGVRQTSISSAPSSGQSAFSDLTTAGLYQGGDTTPSEYERY